MLNLLSSLVSGWLNGFPWLVGFFIGFSLLAKAMPCNPNQPVLRRGMITDLCYFLFGPIFSRFAFLIFISVGVAILFRNVPHEQLDEYFKFGFGPLKELPIWLQAAIIFIVSDVALYWLHRLFHGKSLWPFHAIHHSPKDVDWLSAQRFHPVNACLAFTLVDVAMVLVGFSPAAIGLMGGVNIVYSAMVHANLNWTFGAFKYIFASPVFHRWHHTTQKEGMNKNFAPTFPVIDIIFGTFYMPDYLPEHYGIQNVEIPETYHGQLIWPFRQNH